MSIPVNVNGETIQYPEINNTGWANEATDFAIQVSGAFSKLGLDTGTTVDIPGDLDVTGDTTLDSTLDVTGNTNLNGSLDVALTAIFASTVTIVDDLAVDTDTLFVDVSADMVGINTASPSEALDVTGNIKSSGSITGTSATLTNLTVDTDLIKTDSANSRVGINNATPTKDLDVTGEILASSNITTGGLLIADDSTSTSAPPITFTGDANTGIGRSGADTLDFITGGVPRARISSVGLQSSVVPDLSGSNTTLYNEYKCRAWVNFNGTLSSPITPRKNGNISSITKAGSGNYTITFLNNMPDSDYIVVGSCLGGSGISYGIFGLKNSASTNTQSASQVQITTGYVSTTNGDGALYDHPNIFFSVFR